MATTSFSLDIARFVAKTGLRMDLVIRKVGLDILRSVVLRTPVGNPTLWKSKPPKGYVGGRARGNWITTWAVPADFVILGDTAISRGGDKPINAGADTIIAGYRRGQTLYIVNNLPYIMALENGWSTQAPSGMIGVTVTEYQEFLNDAIIDAQRKAP